MPSKPPRICACGLKVPGGERCQCQKANDRRRKAEYDATRPSSAERGYGGKWRRERATYLFANPVCRMCDEPSTVVDHIVPHRMDLKLFWRRSNWQPLCQSCHNSKKQAAERSGN